MNNETGGIFAAKMHDLYENKRKMPYYTTETIIISN